MEKEEYTAKDVQIWLKNGETLEYADLGAISLVGANLSKISFKGANLEGADLRKAKLQDADFSEANLKNAKLDMAVLSGADLSNACLKDSTLTHAFMRSVVVSGTDFTGADLRHSHLNGAIGCTSAKFDGADLRGAHLEHTCLDAQNLKKVGAKIAGQFDDYPTLGLRTRVFDFFKVDEEPKHYVSRIFSFLFKSSTSLAKNVLSRKK